MKVGESMGKEGYTVIPDSFGEIGYSELSYIEKGVLCRVISLAQGRPCNMANADFASRFGIHPRKVTEHIRKLIDKGWLIDISKERTKRELIPTEKALAIWEKGVAESGTVAESGYSRKRQSNIAGNGLKYSQFRQPRIHRLQEEYILTGEQDHAKEKTAKKEKRIEELFCQFYAAYPRKVAKKAAQKAFAKIKDVGDKLPAIIQALEKQKAEYQQQHDFQRDGWRFFPHPATWLNREQWEDETETAAPSQPRQLRRWTQEDERREGDKERREMQEMEARRKAQHKEA